MSFPSGSYDRMLQKMEDYNIGGSLHAVGILFAKPDVPFVKNEILKNIKRDNEASGRNIDFFFAGYCADKTGKPDEIVINAPRNQKWYYSESMFKEFIGRITEHSEWKYSNETELLLLYFRGKKLRFDKSLVICLERAVSEKGIRSVSNLFEKIFSKALSEENTTEFSDSCAFQANTSSLIDEVCAFLNDNRGNSNIFKVEDLSKK